MAFIRDVFQQSNNANRRTLNSTPSYTGGIFPVRPGASAAITISASVLSLFGNYLTGRGGAKSGSTNGLLDGIFGVAKDAARIGIQANELAAGPVAQVPILFQYFPSSIHESKSSGIETTTVPGAALPVPTFSGSTPRSISMRITFSRERWTPNSPALPASSWDKYNVDVAVAVQALRALSYPIGGNFEAVGTSASTGVTPQPFLLSLPGVKIGIESDSIFCFLEGYSVEYVAFFPDGQPRLAHVDLTMQEMLIDLTKNVTGRSFANVLNAYANGSAQVFRLAAQQDAIGVTKAMDVSTNKLG